MLTLPHVNWAFPPNVKEYWAGWLTDRATYCTIMCAEHFQNDPTFAAYMSSQFELYEERGWLLMVNTTEVVEVVE